jgi:microcystin-dependent protein
MGCNSNCFINCDNITSDQCVQYTGADVPALGICQGDQLSTVEVAILTELQSALEGTGIEPQNVTLENCPWLAGLFGTTDPNLSNLLQLLIDSECSLKEMIDTINETLASQSTNFNTLCLQGLSPNPTTNNIIQSVINMLCGINTVVAAIPSTYVKASDINNLVQQQISIYLANSQSGQVEYFQYLPIGAILPYYGSLSNFDLTGKGLATGGLTNMYLCNGLNGTPDLRGFALVGAVKNVSGGALDPSVDPANPDNPNWALGDLNGENKHLLNINELPNHFHSITDPGHSHTYSYPTPDKFSGNNYDAAKAIAPVTQNTSTSFTGITQTNTTGAGQKHNNIQPSKAVYWIIRML